MKYIVKVNYTKFRFTDDMTALNYAELSKKNATEDVDVEITLEEEDEDTMRQTNAKE